MGGPQPAARSRVPDWLDRVFESDVDTSVPTLIGRQLIALALGVVVGLIYRWTVNGGARGASGGMWTGRPRREPRMEMVATLVLLTVLIAMMTAVIGDNIARAFSIVGALSIVRFRTVVEDTRDTAFVICAVAVGMAVGAGHMVIPLITLPIVALAAMLFRPARGIDSSIGTNVSGGSRGPDAAVHIIVRTGSGNAIDDSAVRRAIEPFAGAVSVIAIESARQGASIETTYDARLRQLDGAHALIAALNSVEGVQNVEMRRV